MYTETQLSKLIEDVEKEFTAHLAKAEEGFKVSLAKSEDANAAPAEQPLVKAEEGEKKPEEKKPEAEGQKEEGKEQPHDGKEAAPAEGEKKPEAEAKPEGEQPPGEAAAPEHKEGAPAEGSENCDYDEQDLSHMHKMYMSMSKAELKVHHDSCRKALDEKGMAKSGEQEQPMAKTEENKPVEVKAEDIKASPELDLVKSELNAANVKYDELKKTFDAVSAFLTKLVEKKAAPAGKAITSLDAIAKSEGAGEEKQLSKAEIDQILLKKSSDPSLKKSDRDAINAFYLNGSGINSISHLLK